MYARSRNIPIPDNILLKRCICHLSDAKLAGAAESGAPGLRYFSHICPSRVQFAVIYRGIMSISRHLRRECVSNKSSPRARGTLRSGTSELCGSDNIKFTNGPCFIHLNRYNSYETDLKKNFITSIHLSMKNKKSLNI